MKVGILTFHDGINHGGFFQAFSTYQFVKSKGFDVEIINYKNKKHWLSEYKAFLLTKNPKTFILNIVKIFYFKRDRRLMNLGPFATDVRRLQGVYDVVIVGSDIVWNYEWEFLGRDSIYFGHGLNSRKWVSYAASFGAVNCETSIVPDYVAAGLKRFSHISVRDENSKSLVKRACGRDADIVLDPVFLLNTKNMEKGIKIRQAFLLVYAYTLKASEVQQARDFAKNNNLIVVAIGYSQTWADYNLINVGPFEWLGYFDKASYVLTSTFHGTLYSVKYKKNFITSNNEAIANKTKTILSRLGLIDRLSMGEVSFDKLYSDGINYALIDSILEPLIEKSKSYLIEALKND